MNNEPSVLTRMRLSCCWGDNLNEKELNEVVDYINHLQQQNQALKEAINNFHYCPYDDKCGELYDCSKEEYQGMIESNMKLSLQLDLYKSVLDEIREYITNNKLFNFVPDEEEIFEYVSDGKVKSELLQILDKAKESK